MAAAHPAAAIFNTAWIRDTARYYIHYTNVENYPEGTVREFDRAVLLAAFDTIRDSVTVTAPADDSITPAATTTTP